MVNSMVVIGIQRTICQRREDLGRPFSCLFESKVVCSIFSSWYDSFADLSFSKFVMSIFTHIWALLFVHCPRPPSILIDLEYWAGVDSAWKQRKTRRQPVLVIAQRKKACKSRTPSTRTAVPLIGCYALVGRRHEYNAYRLKKDIIAHMIIFTHNLIFSNLNHYACCDSMVAYSYPSLDLIWRQQ